MNPLTNIQTDQTINERNLADIPTSIPTMQNSKFKSKFIVHNEEERKSFLDDRENQNTKRKIMYSVNTFKQFLNDIKSELETYTQFNQLNSTHICKNFSSGSENKPKMRMTKVNISQLKWGDVTIGTEPNGTKKLTYNERLTKTQEWNKLKKNTRAYAPKSWNENHITMYLEYKSHRPPDMCSPKSPFYLGVNTSVKANYWYIYANHFWQKNAKSDERLVKKSNVCTSKKFTNHSCHKIFRRRNASDCCSTAHGTQKYRKYKKLC
ncbi:unnamed protein product [Mytilus coruscus]|uniref:Uncharacterized protein n=1 Tax=Mytilus coruscus TaxID=42192 RepID=A0A6J8AN89_MYTCO|nr:unnamed protein product [Mytilus coruscus]